MVRIAEVGRSLGRVLYAERHQPFRLRSDGEEANMKQIWMIVLSLAVPLSFALSGDSHVNPENVPPTERSTLRRGCE